LSVAKPQADSVGDVRLIHQNLVPYIDVNNTRSHKIEFWVRIVGGQLSIDIEYSRNLYANSTVRQLQEETLKQVESLLSLFELNKESV